MVILLKGSLNDLLELLGMCQLLLDLTFNVGGSRACKSKLSHLQQLPPNTTLSPGELMLSRQSVSYHHFKCSPDVFL